MKTNYILFGDVRDKIKDIPDKSIQMCVTSPPYYDLRNYEKNSKQIGLEKKQITICPLCTYKEIDIFHSWRREKKRGLQWSGIISKGPT